MNNQHNIGSQLPPLTLESIQGEKINLSDFRGRRMILILNRCIACPFTSLSLSRISQQLSEFEDTAVVMVFPSSIDQLNQLLPSELNHANLYLLSDPELISYESLGIKTSEKGRWNTLLNLPNVLASLKYFTRQIFSIRGKLTQMPGCILVDEYGYIEETQIGNSFTDIVDLGKIQEWIDTSIRLELGLSMGQVNEYLELPTE